jgi:hypothetical protein
MLLVLRRVQGQARMELAREAICTDEKRAWKSNARRAWKRVGRECHERGSLVPRHGAAYIPSAAIGELH